MRDIYIGQQSLRVRATAPALLYYKQAFKTDLLGDMMKLSEVSDDLSKLDSVIVLQIIWAMAKADAFGREFPMFERWLESIDHIDFSDPSFMAAALEEAADGFFRAGIKNGVTAK